MAKNLKMCVLLDVYGDMISEKQYEVMDYYYNQDYSLAEISELLSITRQGVRDSIKRAEEALLEWEEKLKLSEKYNENSARLDKIDSILEKIIRVIDEEQLNDSTLKGLVEELSNTTKELDL